MSEEAEKSESRKDHCTAECGDVPGCHRGRMWPVAPASASNSEEAARLPSNEEYREAIIATCDRVKEFLLEKNEAYGNSAFRPIHVMSQLSAREGILQRIDDKLQRFKNGTPYPGDDNILDTAGYFLLLLTFDSLEQ